MLTRFFRKSKPINFVIPVFIAVILFIVYNFIGEHRSFDLSFLLNKLIFLIILLASLIFINFILIKDRVSGYHTYVSFLFIFFCAIKPDIFFNDFSLLSGLFVILGIRRTFALQNGKNITKKVFDAFFWICLASLFYPVSILFIIIPFLGILYHSDNNYRYWLISIIALIGIFILATCYSLFVHDTFFNPLTHYHNFDLISIEYLLRYKFLIPLSIILAFALWFTINNFIDTEHLTLNEKRNEYILIYSLLIGIAVVSFSEGYPSNSGLLFMIIPASLIGGKYFEGKRHLKLKEILLISLVLICTTIGILIKWNLI